MVVVPGGRFTMGSPPTETGRYSNEGPTHEVVIARPFAVGKYEVTLGQFAQFVGETKHEMGALSRWHDRTQSDRHPVTYVGWDDAKAYAEWLAKKTGQPYRLLSEAEWEYAARAGTMTSRFWGNDQKSGCDFANVYWCGAKSTAPVGQFRPNAFGLYDMLGNVWEWVEDCYDETYAGAPTDGSAWVSDVPCMECVVRGGSWFSHLNPANVRSAIRGKSIKFLDSPEFGFRVARTLP
jgi:formylglycine-generating enzyme required for sulfatase activity